MERQRTGGEALRDVQTEKSPGGITQGPASGVNVGSSSSTVPQHGIVLGEQKATSPRSASPSLPYKQPVLESHQRPFKKGSHAWGGKDFPSQIYASYTKTMVIPCPDVVTRRFGKRTGNLTLRIFSSHSCSPSRALWLLHFGLAAVCFL